MANAYTFHCPIKGDGTGIEHCSEVHSLSMKGRPQDIEDKVCALAHQCWMCPFRNAVRVGGPWSHYDKIPRAETPQTNPARLPADLLTYALSHTVPRDSDYRRCGMWGEEVGQHDALFQKLQTGASVKAAALNAATRSAGGSKPAARKRSTVDQMLEHDENAMAKAVTAAVKDEKRSQERAQSASKSKATRDTSKKPKAPQRSVQSAPSAPLQGMTLAERARLMKEKRVSA